METEKRRNYKDLCFEVFHAEGGHGIYFPILVYTGRKDQDERPVFKTLLAESPVKVRRDGTDYWGISCYDTETGESAWYDYRDCVSLEDFRVLGRLLRSRFGWMRQINGLVEETMLMAKAQYREGR